MGQPNRADREDFNKAITTTVVWVAGLTLLIIFAALFAGLWLDKILASKPLFTIGLLLVSIPITLLVTFRVVRAATARIRLKNNTYVTEEDSDLGK